jgi:Skp family chaperone for outer membrane proteins
MCRSIMDSVRTEGSLLTSLNELRAIEHQRLADERAAIEAAIQAKRDERARAERIAQEAEAERIAAERDAQRAAEQARAEAERQARMAIEAAEAAERARHMVALEARRRDEEMALRREVARRQRPRWMMGLTGFAVTAAIGLAWFALERQTESRRAVAAQQRAVEAKANAEAEAQRAQQELDKLARELQELDSKVSNAVERVRIAQNEADRRAAQDSLRQLQLRQTELEEQQRRRDEERRRQERLGGIHVSSDCLNNAVCK